MRYHLNHSPINFYFKHSKRDFIVDEIPLYEFSGSGEHLILRVRKKSLSTWEMLHKISNSLNIKIADIGYAGLKDKHAMATQYISIHKKYENDIDKLSIDGIKILEKFYHKNKIKIGHLKGNRFFIRLKKVTTANATKIEQVLKHLEDKGMPNYFGFQRFGNDGNNHNIGKAICKAEHIERNKKLRTFFINAYQSSLFNNWLDARFDYFKSKDLSCDNSNEILAIDPLGLIKGDIAMHYPQARSFQVEDVETDVKRIKDKSIVVSGLLAGTKSIRSKGLARLIEEPFDKQTGINGYRRLAWIYPQDIQTKYDFKSAWMSIFVTLQKGAYATVFIEQIAKQSIKKIMEGI